jgi:acetyl esterase/lipase
MVVMALLCAGSAPAAEGKNPKTLESAGSAQLDLRYKQTAEGDLLLDFYYPAGEHPAPVPVIFYTHGGGWATRTRKAVAHSSFRIVFNRLLEAGYCVVSVEYRLVKKDGPSTIRDCVIDAKDAMRYVAKNSKELGVDPQRFFAMGDSAGGQIAQMLILTAPEVLPGDPALADVSYKMAGGVSWYGPCDFEKTSLYNHDDRANFHDRFGARIYRGTPTAEEKLALYREVSPINYLTKNSPPFLMMQGDKDSTIPVKHLYYMQAKATELGAPVDFQIVKNAGHNWRSVDAAIEPTRNQIIDQTVQFFIDHL